MMWEPEDDKKRRYIKNLSPPLPTRINSPSFLPANGTSCRASVFVEGMRFLRRSGVTSRTFPGVPSRTREYYGSRA
jgi:hypothetical protein